MKLKKSKKINILSTNLINNRTYLGWLKSKKWNPDNKNYLVGFRNNFCIFDLNQTVINLRNALKLIYEYNKSNKKILFVGFPELEKKKFNKLLKNSHYYINHNLWINGLLSNKQIILSNSKFKTLKKKPDLLVIYQNSIELETLKEGINLNIPIVSFTNVHDNINKIPYSIPGNFYSVGAGKLYYNFLLTIIKDEKNKDTNKQKL